MKAAEKNIGTSSQNLGKAGQAFFQMKTEESAPFFDKSIPDIQNQVDSLEPNQEDAPSGLIVEDNASPQSGQMRKGEFLSTLKEEVCQAVDQELSGMPFSSSACPYIRRSFDKHKNSPPSKIESVLNRYVPGTRGATSTRGIIESVKAHTRGAVQQWLKNGDLSAVPLEIASRIPSSVKMMGGAGRALGSVDSAINAGIGVAGGLFFKEQQEGAKATRSPMSTITSLGKGHALESNTKGVMEDAFSTNFSDVEIHTDSNAANLSKEMNAKAFTVGNHMAFGSGEYQPGTPLGDGLIAHELTHVEQQKRARSESSNATRDLEEEADLAAGTVIGERHLGEGQSLYEKVQTRMKSGLSIQRCGSNDTEKTEEKEKDKTVPDKPIEKKSKYDKWKEENLGKVKAVKSLKVEEFEKNKATEEASLKTRLTAREKVIKAEIKKVDDYRVSIKKPDAMSEKRDALQKDLDKTLDQIKATEDSKYVPVDRRKKVLDSVKAIEASNDKIEEAKKNWHKYDEKFVGSEELMNVLEEIKITPSELKALIGQESGDLNLSDDEINKGDKAGIAQIGKAEAEKVGYKGEDAEKRKDPSESILIAAKVLRLNLNNAGLNHADFPNQNDYKSMVYAAYNAGGNAIKQSRLIAEKDKKSTIDWSVLTTGEKKSPLYRGLIETYKDKKVPAKFKEVRRYVEGINSRL